MRIHQHPFSRIALIGNKHISSYNFIILKDESVKGVEKTGPDKQKNQEFNLNLLIFYPFYIFYFAGMYYYAGELLHVPEIEPFEV